MSPLNAVRQGTSDKSFPFFYRNHCTQATRANLLAWLPFNLRMRTTVSRTDIFVLSSELRNMALSDATVSFDTTYRCICTFPLSFVLILLTCSLLCIGSPFPWAQSPSFIRYRAHASQQPLATYLSLSFFSSLYSNLRYTNTPCATNFLVPQWWVRWTYTDRKIDLRVMAQRYLMCDACSPKQKLPGGMWC